MGGMPNTHAPQPVVIKRECGGWFAVSPADHPFRIGVIADDEPGVRQAFTRSVARWIALAAKADARASL